MAGGCARSIEKPVSLFMFPSRTRKTLDRLKRYESRNITFMDPNVPWPIVWEKSKGCHVWDAEGKKYLDLTAAFGVCAAGHCNPRIVGAGQAQMATLLHAMGDVHPHRLKADLARELSRITYERWTRKTTLAGTSKSRATAGKTIFSNSGFEAVETALKTALLATDRPGIIAFERGYHGLGYGTLSVTHRQRFRTPFKSQLREFGHFLPFPTRPEELPKVESMIRKVIQRHSIGAILVEPVQGRGGINIPPIDFLPALRRICNEIDGLLILDEILTGFGRTGKWFACEHSGTIPDLICLGKALTGGFPLSACIGRSDLMDRAWPESDGEAIHTSTFLGHPVGCAMALAHINEIKERRLVFQSARLGRFLAKRLTSLRPALPLQVKARALGLLAGLEFVKPDGEPAKGAGLRIMNEMLRKGYLVLPGGEHGNVLSFSPPLIISERNLSRASDSLQSILEKRSLTEPDH